ncbi:MAG: hypothetical protein M1812_002361 [Candelaria pacifica]|nr:MAG: hypothetical protein M1812_002361 [Candelaria pacifica]
MPAPPVDTSLTGYKSGSVDRQDDIYRNRERPQPYPIVQNDSGFESATHLRFNNSSTSSSSSSPSLLGLANSLKGEALLSNDFNFASKSVVDCYESDFRSIKRRHLDESSFQKCLSSLAPASQDQSPHRVLLFALDTAEDATYRARSSFSKAAVEALIYNCDMNILFLPDLLGRPNYWCPELYSSSSSDGTLKSIDFFCQQPRFVIHGPNFVQRSPLSIYMRYDAVKNLTYYIISGPESEECITGFKSLLNLASHDGTEDIPGRPLLQHPLEVHILLSKILCESSQGYINLFRQSMFTQLRAVDELSTQESNADRKGLANVTIELQIISKDVNKLISDVDVASRNLTKTQEALARLECLHPSFPSSPSCPAAHSDLRQQLIDTLQYLHFSMDKQKMWLHNYRDRKDIAMSLVFNLVTQQDAANNIWIAKGMKRDSSSMNGIALLTMIFLPGTFTSTLLGAGLFSAFAQHREIHVSGLWWFWAAITFPLTGVVVIIWISFCWRKELQARWACLTAGRKSGGTGDIEAKA